jgi:probable rRNA maturation factor
MTQVAPHIDILVLTQTWTRADKKITGVCLRAAKAALLMGCRHLPKQHPWRALKDPLEISIALSSDARVRTLNRTYRGQNKSTNVLSFPSESVSAPSSGPVLLGDVILAFETTRREAARDKKTLHAHTTHLVVHGVLHLLGYDHIVNRDAQNMERLERLTLEGLGFADPYTGTVPARKTKPHAQPKVRRTTR